MTTPVVLAVIYLLVLAPMGALRQALGGNPLVHRPGPHGYWNVRPTGTRRPGSMRRQF